MQGLFGALVHGRRTSTDAAASVEAKGAVVVLVAVHGDLATPSLESVKSALARTAHFDAAAATTLAAAAPPPPYAAGVAVVLLDETSAHVATTGGARAYRERGSTLEELATGSYAIQPGDTYLAASAAALEAGTAFFGAARNLAADDSTFRNDGLDDALEQALQPLATFFAVAAARLS